MGGGGGVYRGKQHCISRRVLAPPPFLTWGVPFPLPRLCRQLSPLPPGCCRLHHGYQHGSLVYRHPIQLVPPKKRMPIFRLMTQAGLSNSMVWVHSCWTCACTTRLALCSTTLTCQQVIPSICSPSPAAWLPPPGPGTAASPGPSSTGVVVVLFYLASTA